MSFFPFYSINKFPKHSEFCDPVSCHVFTYSKISHSLELPYIEQRYDPVNMDESQIKCDKMQHFRAHNFTPQPLFVFHRFFWIKIHQDRRIIILKWVSVTDPMWNNTHLKYFDLFLMRSKYLKWVLFHIGSVTETLFPFIDSVLISPWLEIALFLDRLFILTLGVLLTMGVASQTKCLHKCGH